MFAKDHEITNVPSHQRILDAIHAFASKTFPASFVVKENLIVAISGSVDSRFELDAADLPISTSDLRSPCLQKALNSLLSTQNNSDASGSDFDPECVEVDQEFDLCSKSVETTPNQTIQIVMMRARKTDDTHGSSMGEHRESLKSSSLVNWKMRQLELALSGHAVAFWQGDVNQPDWIDARDVEKMLGYRQNQFQNSRKLLRQLIHPDDVQINDRERTKHLEGEVNVSEVRLKTASGNYRWYRIVGEAARDEDGKIECLVGTFTDIDDLKRGQIALSDQLRRRDQFIAMLSHELRNPMAAITFATDYIKTAGSLPQALMPYFDIVSRQTEQMSRLMDDLLDVARITQNKIEVEKILLDIVGLLTHVVESMKATFAHQGQKFTYKLPSSSVIVNGDAVRLKQAFNNLLDNASKYTPRDGEVHLDCSVTDGVVSVKVEDNGCGIEGEEFENIFGLFYQQSAPDQASAAGGMGVGLFLVRHIVEAHSGRVTVTSNGAGQGSTFAINLPLAKKVVTSIAAGENVMFEDLKLAFVEDNADTRNVMSHLLELRGIKVFQFEDGETASTKIPEIVPDVALIDIGLPGKNGYDVASELRQSPGLESTLLIALTGFGQDSDRDRARKAGFDDHVIKPIRVNQLCELIAEHICQ